MNKEEVREKMYSLLTVGLFLDDGSKFDMDTTSVSYTHLTLPTKRIV